MVEYFKEARGNGAEGIMNKKTGADAVYRAGNRGFLWIKLKGLEGAKMADTIDTVIIGASWGKGRRKGFLSPVFCAVWNPETGRYEFLCRVGSGFSDEVLDSLTERLRDLTLPKKPNDVICSDEPDVWLKPEIVVEIMGDELTISNKADAGASHDDPNGYGLRFPVFQRFREDKSAHQITTTQEIIEFYQSQG
jgi:DNA ligase 1